ncbi:hypothetical protein ACRAWD_22910 [Caulobacter segnis]
MTRQAPPTNAAVTGTVDAVTESATQSSTLYTTGFKVYPIDWLMVRAGVSSGFRTARGRSAQLSHGALHRRSRLFGPERPDFCPVAGQFADRPPARRRGAGAGRRLRPPVRGAR